MSDISGKSIEEKLAFYQRMFAIEPGEEGMNSEFNQSKTYHSHGIDDMSEAEDDYSIEDQLSFAERSLHNMMMDTDYKLGGTLKSLEFNYVDPSVFFVILEAHILEDGSVFMKGNDDKFYGFASPFKCYKIMSRQTGWNNPHFIQQMVFLQKEINSYIEDNNIKSYPVLLLRIVDGEFDVYDDEDDVSHLSYKLVPIKHDDGCWGINAAQSVRKFVDIFEPNSQMDVDYELNEDDQIIIKFLDKKDQDRAYNVVAMCGLTTFMPSSSFCREGLVMANKDKPKYLLD